jgi:hypothetical protein
MKPYQTIILLFAIGTFIVLQYLGSKRPDPRIEQLSNCYVELALLHLQADTTAAHFAAQKDSVLNTLGETEQSLQEMLADLKDEPNKLIDVWELVDKKLRARKDALEPVKP